MNDENKHVVVFARRFSVSKLSSPPCVVASPTWASTSPPSCVVASPQLSVIHSPPTVFNFPLLPSPNQTSRTLIPVEVVNINRFFDQNNDIQQRKQNFRKKYENSAHSREIDVDVSTLTSTPIFTRRTKESSEDGPKSKCSSSYKRKQRMSKTVSFDDSGKVVNEQYFLKHSASFSQESSVFDETEDPLGHVDFSTSKTYFESFAEPKSNDRASQTYFKTPQVPKLTQTTPSAQSDSNCQTSIVSSSDCAVQTVSPPQNNLNKVPNIVVTPPTAKQNISKPSSVFMQSKSDPTGSQSKLDRQKNLISNLHLKYVDSSTAQKSDDKSLNNANAIENLHSQYFNNDTAIADQPKHSIKNLKNTFESMNSVESTKMKHEFRKTNVKSQIGAMSTKLSEDFLLENLVKEASKLPMYKLVEFEKSFVKHMTDRELLEIVSSRFRSKPDDDLNGIIKDMCKNVEVDDMLDIVENYLNDKPYNEGKKISMKMCENFLNKKDLTEFVMRNYSSMSENNRQVLATSILEDLPYDSMRKILQSQFPKLKEKDIPNILNNIQTDPNRRELEKAVCILSSRLSSLETQKLVKALGKGMKNEDVAKTIKQLFDYLPKHQTEGIARKYVEVKKFYAEKTTETKAIEVKKTLSKQVGTDHGRETTQVIEKSRKIIKIQGESWFANDKKMVNRSCQTEAVNRLLFKDKSALQNTAGIMSRAKKRIQDKISTTNRPKLTRDDVMIGLHPNNEVIPRSTSMVEVDGANTTNSRKKLMDEIEKLKQEKQNVYEDYQEYFNLALDQEEELRYQEDELERSKRQIYDAQLEVRYITEDRDLAYKDIKDLEDELADARIMIHDLRNRQLTVVVNKDGKHVNAANADRLNRELERYKDVDEQLELLHEDFVDMESKWIAEEKRKRYFEEMAMTEERKCREMQQQLYMMITNELTPATLKAKIVSEQPESLENLPKLSGSQLNALLTLFVAAGALPEDKVPKHSEVFTLAELQKSGQYTPDQVAGLLTGNVNFYASPSAGVGGFSPAMSPGSLVLAGAGLSPAGMSPSAGVSPGGTVLGGSPFGTGSAQGSPVGPAAKGFPAPVTNPAGRFVGLAPGLVYTDKPELFDAAGLGMNAVQMPAGVLPKGMNLVSDEMLARAQNAGPAPPGKAVTPGVPPPVPPPAPKPPPVVKPPPAPAAPPAPRAPPAPTAPPAPPPPNAPPVPRSAPPAPPPPNAPPIGNTAPPAPRPPNAPPPPGPPPVTAPLGIDSRLLATSEDGKQPGPPEAGARPPGAYVPRGRLEDLKNRKGRKNRAVNNVVKKKTLNFGPTKPLKVFNWVKLPEAKAANSIWKDVDEVDMIHMLNLDEIDELFQSRKHVKKEGGDGKKKTLTIVDPKRAQNFTILLKKFKKTNEELIDIVIYCDKDNIIPLDMWEQLLRYIPTKEEVQMLKDLDPDPDVIASLNRADKFFHSAVSIYHYEERIQAVNFIKKFDERIKTIKPKIRALVKASTEVVKSDKLKQLLTLILGFGNYFNFGKRGNAVGFKMETLTKICDTKATDNKLTLMVYLVETIELIFPELDDFIDDILHVPIAAKVALAELKSDVIELQAGHKLLLKECEHMNKNPQLKGAQRFQTRFNVFLDDIKETMVELEQMMGDMKKKYTIATSHFAENSSVEPDAFFGYFNTFIQQFRDAKDVLEKKREEEERKKKKQLAAEAAHSARSSPTPLSSRPISPLLFSSPNSPIPEDLIIDLLPSLEALEQQDHDLMMNDLFALAPDSAEGSNSPQLGTGSMRRRRKRKDVSNVKTLDRER